MTQPPTILVADDEKSISTALRIRLSGAGYRVITAQDGRRAFELTGEHKPDLLILDVDLPRCDGFSLVQSMDQIPALAAIPVIYISGAVDERELHATGARLGAIAMMRKPFDFHELIGVVRLVLSPSRCAA